MTWAELTDAQKFWKLMHRAGTEGVHSHTLRSQGVSGNPSQRAKDIVSKGFPVYTAREPRGKRPGSRYWLEPSAPDFATPVLANREARSAPETPNDSEIYSTGADPALRLEVWDYTEQAA